MPLIPGNRFVILPAVWDFSVSVSPQSLRGVRVSDTNTTLSVGEIKYDTKIVSLVDVSAQMEGSA
jgi:hypothetical protein